MPSYKLTYFDAKGRGESIRLALHAAGIPFTDERLTREQFAEKKENLPFGQVPVLTIDDKTVIPQELAILKYIGRGAGLYPSDREEALEVDIMLGVCDDFLSTFMVFFSPDLVGNVQAKTKAIEERTPKLLANVEKRLASKETTYSAGNKLTVADLRLYVLLSNYKLNAFEGFPKDLLDKYPHVNKLYQAIDSHEKVVSWNKSQAK